MDSMGMACSLCTTTLSLALALRMVVDPRVRDLLNLFFAAMAFLLGALSLLDVSMELTGAAATGGAMGTALVVALCVLLVALLCVLVAYLLLRFRQTRSWHTSAILGLAMMAYGIACVARLPFHELLGVVCACALLLVFMDLRSRREAELAESEARVARARADAVLSQIQPHFLYNTLTAIRGLCRSDPKRAADTLGDFSAYLRGNMSSLEQRLPIPLRDELRHTEKYLELEHLRLGDRLNVEYDVRDTAFELPALTIQTLAENAVRHGISKRPDGGTLRISTCLDDGMHRVTIEDDGVGFDVKTLKGLDDEHVGVAAARLRLRRMCGGTLDVNSVPGRGTCVSIAIPVEDGSPAR
ncbi:MAG: histidine kinase [Coriobacteriia bacterium]|nr:histidine kinase [Coriobacteriia bacterium]MBS5477261.1 histidine kinase [Coriobacteriia bacterium]